MQGAAFLVGEVITFVVSNQVNNRSLRQGCRLVEHEPPLLDMGSERAHVATVRVSERPGKHSRCSTEPVDLVEPGDDLGAMQDASDLLVGELLRQTLRLIHDAFESAFFGRDGARLLAAMSAFTPSADLAERLAGRLRAFPRGPGRLSLRLGGRGPRGSAQRFGPRGGAGEPGGPRRRLDLLAALVAAGRDDVDLAILDGADVVLRFEAVRPNRLVYAREGFDHGTYYSRAVREYFDLLPILAIQGEALKRRLLHA